MFRLRRSSPQPDPGHLHLEVDGAAVAVALRRRANARRMTLRVPPGDGPPVLTVPAGASVPAAERFLRQNAAWLSRHLARRRPAEPFVHGARIPVRGALHLVHHVADRRGTAWLEPFDAAGEAGSPTHRLPPPFGRPVAGRLCVTGREEHLHRRVSDALRAWARADITAAVEEFAERVGRRPASIAIRDTRSQWGACTAKGALSFSWRLVLAPPPVLRYVAAHEVAHLVHMNHGPAFWRLNAELAPDMDACRDWLRHHGGALHAVGVRPPAVDAA